MVRDTQAGYEIIAQYPGLAGLECVLSEYAAIKARDGLELLAPPQAVPLYEGKVKLSLNLPVHSVSLIILAHP